MSKRNIGRTIILEESTQPTVLGFDVSSKTIGWGLMTKDNLLAYGHIRPLNSKYGIIERLNDVYDTVFELTKKFSPQIIAIEEITLFMSGRSTAKTTTILSAFNRLVGVAAYRVVNNVKFYPVSTIRKIIKNSIGLKYTISKDEMPEIIKKYLEKNFSDVVKRGGETAIQTYDEADGIAVAWACAKEEL
jgi:Holliday junction resolvasome RuvABC endonuclease subunit